MDVIYKRDERHIYTYALSTPLPCPHLMQLSRFIRAVCEYLVYNDHNNSNGVVQMADDLPEAHYMQLCRSLESSALGHFAETPRRLDQQSADVLSFAANFCSAHYLKDLSQIEFDQELVRFSTLFIGLCKTLTQIHCDKEPSEKLVHAAHAIIDVKEGRKALRSRVEAGEEIKILVLGKIVGIHSLDDGVSREFSVLIQTCREI